MNWTLVTGGARGLGAEVCKRLAKQGHSLIIHYNTSESEAQKLADSCREFGIAVHLVQGSFTTKESTKKVIEDVLDLNLPIKNLVNNVGHYIIESLLNTTENDWYDLFTINVHAPFLFIKGLSDNIIRQQGAIINIGVAGLQSQADTYSAAYTITKQALLGMTKSLAKELSSQHVTVNMISPGYMVNSIDLPEDLSKIPMQRAVELSEVAETVMYLLGDSAKNITGQNIEVSGGVRM